MMDEMKLNLKSKFMKGIVTKLIAMVIKEKLGYKIDIELNELDIVATDGKIHLHANIDAETTNEELMKIVKSIGSEGLI